MVIKKMFLRAVMVASSVSMLSAAQPAWSNQWSDMFRNILVPPTGVAVSDSITVRETHLTDRIIEAVNANKLSPSDVQNLKVQLDRVSATEAHFRSDGPLGAMEIASLNSELNKVESSFNSMVSGTTSGGSVSVNPDFNDAFFLDLKQRITTNLASGRLTLEEARTLKSQYDHILNDRNSFKADGTISPEEASHLNPALEELKRSIVSNTRDNQAWPGINGQQAVEAKRIEDGIASGRITRQEYNDLKAEVDRIAILESHARSNGLQLDETITLATDLTNLNQKISVALNNRSTAGGGFPGGGYHGGGYDGRDYPGGNGSFHEGPGSKFDIRQGNVMRKIDDRASSGQLSAADAADLRGDFRRLEQLEASYRADGNLTGYEVDVLQRGLDTIVQELQEKSTSESTANQYPEIDRKQADLKRRIDEGVARGRIRGLDGQKLNASLNWIASIEAAFRQSGGRLDKAEADRILSDLDRLSAKIDRVAVNPLQDLQNRRADLQRKIDENTSSGKLSQRSSRDLRRELDRISYSLQVLGPNGTVRPDVIARISADMDRLNSSITTRLSYGGDTEDNWHGHHNGGGNWNHQH